MALVKGARTNRGGAWSMGEEEGCPAAGNAAAPWGSRSDKLAKMVDCQTWKATVWQAVKCSRLPTPDFRARTSRQNCYFWFCCNCSWAPFCYFSAFFTPSGMVYCIYVLYMVESHLVVGF